MSISLLDDVQKSKPKISLPLKRVGVKRINFPFSFQSQRLVGSFDFYVNVAASERGTHMSRFLEILNNEKDSTSLEINFGSMTELLNLLLDKLEAQEGGFEIQTTYFRQKIAPVSRTPSLMDYGLTIGISGNRNICKPYMEIKIPVTTLCPCSKQISKYGAHNQRSIVTLKANIESSFDLNTVIEAIEAQSSCEIFSLIKRPDEKFVTEKAYENPKFVEDMMRDILCAMTAFENSMDILSIECENLESIHNHSAYALYTHNDHDDI